MPEPLKLPPVSMTYNGQDAVYILLVIGLLAAVFLCVMIFGTM